MGPSVKLNLTSLLQIQAQQVGDKPAIFEPQITRRGRLTHHSISFHDLELSSARLAGALRAQGLNMGDRVLVMVPMSIDLYITLIALFRIGVVAVFIDPWVGRKRLSQFAHQVKPKALIGIPKAQILRWIPGLLPKLKMNVVAGSLWLAPFSKSLKRLIGLVADSDEITAVTQEDPALITFTTGSTGTPKGVIRTHGFLMAQHEVLTQHLGLKQADIDLPLLPVFVLNNLANGISSVLPAMDTREVSKSDPAQLYQQIKELEVTTTVGSPVIYERLATYCQKNDLEFSHLRSLHTGGAPVSRELILNLQSLMPGGQAHIVYGSTEAEPISSISARDLKNLIGEPGDGQCVGLPDPSTNVVIIEASTHPLTTLDPLPQGEVGEIVVTGDHVNKNYFDNPEAVLQNKIITGDGDTWHRTGDVGKFDAKGRLFLLGRVDQVVEHEGVRLYPLQIEPLINVIPGVERSAFFQNLDGKTHLACTLKDAGMASLIKEIQTQLNRTHIESLSVLHVSQIPMDPRHNSKIDYLKLKQELSELTIQRYSGS